MIVLNSFSADIWSLVDVDGLKERLLCRPLQKPPSLVDLGRRPLSPNDFEVESQRPRKVRLANYETVVKPIEKFGCYRSTANEAAVATRTVETFPLSNSTSFIR